MPLGGRGQLLGELPGPGLGGLAGRVRLAGRLRRLAGGPVGLLPGAGVGGGSLGLGACVLLGLGPGGRGGLGAGLGVAGRLLGGGAVDGLLGGGLLGGEPERGGDLRGLDQPVRGLLGLGATPDRGRRGLLEPGPLLRVGGALLLGGPAGVVRLLRARRVLGRLLVGLEPRPGGDLGRLLGHQPLGGLLGRGLLRAAPQLGGPLDRGLQVGGRAPTRRRRRALRRVARVVPAGPACAATTAWGWGRSRPSAASLGHPRGWWDCCSVDRVPARRRGQYTSACTSGASTSSANAAAPAMRTPGSRSASVIPQPRGALGAHGDPARGEHRSRPVRRAGPRARARTSRAARHTQPGALPGQPQADRGAGGGRGGRDGQALVAALGVVGSRR